MMEWEMITRIDLYAANRYISGGILRSGQLGKYIFASLKLYP